MKTAFTEVDVRMILPADTAKVAGQSEGYGLLLRACLLVRNCISYTAWGVTDRYSWIPGVFEGQGSALLWDENYQAKPAYYTVRDMLLLSRHR